LQAAHGKFDGEETVEQLFLNLEAAFDRTAAALIAEVGGDFSEQGVGHHGGYGKVEGAAGFRHFDFEAEAKTFFFGRHKALGLQELLACAEVEFERNCLPGCLQFAAHDADDAFENLFLDLGDGAGNFAAIALPAEHDVDDGESDGEIELEHSRGPDRGEIDGGEIGFFGDALDELEEGEMLGGNQAAVENDAQVAADGGGEIAGKAFVELVDGAQLLASDLSGLADVPDLDHRPGGGGGRGIAGARLPHHVIDFCLVEYFFHVLVTTSRAKARLSWFQVAARLVPRLPLIPRLHSHDAQGHSPSWLRRLWHERP